MTSPSTLPSYRSLLEEAPEHLKLIGFVAVNRAHLGRTCCRLMSILADIGLPAAQALWPALTSKAMQIQILSKRRFTSQEKMKQRVTSQEKMKQVESCLVALKRCVDLQEEMENTCYGIGRRGLVLSPTSDEYGPIVQVTRKQLRQLADDIGNCTAELDRLASTVRLDEGRQYTRTEDVNVVEAAPLTVRTPISAP